MRVIAIVLVVIAAFLAGIVWQRQMSPPQQQATEQAAPAPDAGGAAPAMPGGAPAAGGEQVLPPTASDPGVAWNVPSHWSEAGARPMRLATYTIPASGGDAEAGECAVFYFGPSQGGGVEDNIQRWIGQFKDARDTQQSVQDVAGMKLHRVHVAGTYLAPSGPMMQSTATKSGYLLIGAIVEGPKGAVFFKLTGPEKTVRAAATDFDAMLASLHKS